MDRNDSALSNRRCYTALRKGNLLVIGLGSRSWTSATDWEAHAFRDGNWVRLDIGPIAASLLREAMEKQSISREREAWRKIRHTVIRLKKWIEEQRDLGRLGADSTPRCASYEPSHGPVEKAEGDEWNGVDRLVLRMVRQAPAPTAEGPRPTPYTDRLAQRFAGSPYQPPRAFRVVQDWLREPGSRGAALLFGGAGCGKSRLGYQLSLTETTAIVVLRANDVVGDLDRSDRRTSLWDAILQRARDTGPEWADRLAKGTAAAFIDGIDEAFPAYFPHCGPAWQQFEDLLRGTGRQPQKLVLTCRSTFDPSYRNRLVSLARVATGLVVDIDPLTPQQLEALWLADFAPDTNEAREAALCQLRGAVLAFSDLCFAPRVLLNLARFVRGKGYLASTRYEVFGGLFDEEDGVARSRGLTGAWCDDAAALLLRQQQTARISDTISAQVPAVGQYLTAMRFPLDLLAETAFFLPCPAGEVTVANRSVTEYLLARALLACARGAPGAILQLPMLRRQPPHAEVVRLFGEGGRALCSSDNLRVIDNLVDVLKEVDHTDQTFLTSNALSLLASIYRGPLREAASDMQNRHLPRAILNGADLSDMDFTGADLTNAVFGGARLTRTKFVRATLEMVYLASPAEIRDLDSVRADDGRIWVAWAKADASVRVAWLDPGEELDVLVSDRLNRLVGHHEKVNQVRWIDANRLLSCSNDASIRLWERQGRDRWTQRVLWIARGSVECLRLSRFSSPDCPRWVASGHDGCLAIGSDRVGDVREVSPSARHEHKEMRFACEFLEKDVVLSSCFAGHLHLVRILEDRTHLTIHVVPLPSVARSPAEWFSLDVSAEGAVALGGREGVLVGTYRAGEFEWNPAFLGNGRVRSVRFMPDGRLVWSESNPARLCVYHIGTGQLTQCIDPNLGNGWVWVLHPLAGGRLLAGATSGEILDVRAGIHCRVSDRELAHLETVGMDLTGQIGLTAERVDNLMRHGAVNKRPDSSLAVTRTSAQPTPWKRLEQFNSHVKMAVVCILIERNRALKAPITKAADHLGTHPSNLSKFLNEHRLMKVKDICSALPVPLPSELQPIIGDERDEEAVTSGFVWVLNNARRKRSSNLPRRD